MDMIGKIRQLARLKAWKFGAKTERMNAEQRDIFEETLACRSFCYRTVRGPGTGSPPPRSGCQW